MPVPLNLNSKTFATIAHQVSSKSAVNPVLWACFVISLPLFLFSPYVTMTLSIIFIVIASIPIILFVFSYIYMLFKNPNLLRSEEYQIRADALKIFGNKDNPLDVGASDVVAIINNPSLPAPTKQE